MAHKPAYLYAAKCGRFIKIGISVNPWMRSRTVVDYSAPPEMKGRRIKRILDVVRGARHEETSLHNALSPYRIKGEWYRKECLRSQEYRDFFGSRKTITE